MRVKMFRHIQRPCQINVLCQKIKGLKPQCDPDGEKSQEVCSTHTLIDKLLLKIGCFQPRDWCHAGLAEPNSLSVRTAGSKELDLSNLYIIHFFHFQFTIRSQKMENHRLFLFLVSASNTKKNTKFELQAQIKNIKWDNRWTGLNLILLFNWTF